MKKFFSIIMIFGMIIFNPSFAFSDVTEDFWAYEKILEMYRSGIISGFEDGTFKPGNTITREQAAAIMANFFELSENDNTEKFEDVAPGYWSEPYVNSVGMYMPTDSHDGKSYFRPQEAATRVEIAEAIIKIIGYDENEPNYEIIENFNDKSEFSENDEKYIALVAQNRIMVGDDKSNFRPNSTITRAEFCALIYNIYLMRDELKDQLTERVVMTVNGQEVSYDEFNLYFGLQKKVYESMFGSTDILNEEIEGTTLYEIVKESTKDAIANDKLKLAKASELGVELSDEVIEKTENEANGVTGAEICAFYGITSDDLIKINSEGLLITELAKKLYEISDHSAHEHLDISQPVDTVKYNARHILLSTEGLNEEDKRKVLNAAEELLMKAQNGEDFAGLAKEYSADAGSKDNGGLYEDIELGEFVSEFEEAALSLSAGMIYPEIVVSNYGYHIIKLESKQNTVRELTEEEKLSVMEADLEQAAAEWFKNAVIEVNKELYERI